MGKEVRIFDASSGRWISDGDMDDMIDRRDAKAARKAAKRNAAIAMRARKKYRARDCGALAELSRLR